MAVTKPLGLQTFNAQSGNHLKWFQGCRNCRCLEGTALVSLGTCLLLHWLINCTLNNWSEPEWAPHKLVVTVRCTSVACPKFYSDNTESPTLVVVRASGVPENLQYQNGKPHMLRNMWCPMFPLIPEKSDLKGDENLSDKTNGKFWRRFAHMCMACYQWLDCLGLNIQKSSWLRNQL